MTRRRGAKRDRAAREVLFAEETAYAEARRTNTIDRGRPATFHPRLPSGFAGIDYATRAGGMIVSFGNPRIPDDVGATVSALDYRDSRQKRNVGGGSSLRETATGGKRLFAAGGTARKVTKL